MPTARAAALAAVFSTLVSLAPAAAQAPDPPFWTGQPDSAAPPAAAGTGCWL